MKNKMFLVGIILILAVFFVTGCGNKNEKDNNNTKKDETSDKDKPLVEDSNLKDVFQFALNGSTLIAVKNDGSVIDIYESNDSLVEYKVLKDKVYTYEPTVTNNGSGRGRFGVIDLTKKNDIHGYEYEEIKSNDKVSSWSLNFTAFDNYLYYVFTSNENDKFMHSIFEYNVEKKEEKLLDKFESNNGTILSSEKENAMFYYKGANRSIYMYNIKDKKETLVSSEAKLELIKDSKLVYSKDKGNDIIYYEYDITTKTSKEIITSRRNSEAVGYTNIVPYENGYIYLDQTDYMNSSLYKISVGSKKELVYTFKNISLDSSVTLLSRDKLLVFTMECPDICNVGKSVVIDVEKKEVIKDIDKKYGELYSVQYIDFNSR